MYELDRSVNGLRAEQRRRRLYGGHDVWTVLLACLEHGHSVVDDRVQGHVVPGECARALDYLSSVSTSDRGDLLVIRCHDDTANGPCSAAGADHVRYQRNACEQTYILARDSLGPASGGNDD
jgi:hypothetical protein